MPPCLCNGKIAGCVGLHDPRLCECDRGCVVAGYALFLPRSSTASDPHVHAAVRIHGHCKCLISGCVRGMNAHCNFGLEFHSPVEVRMVEVGIRWRDELVRQAIVHELGRDRLIRGNSKQRSRRGSAVHVKGGRSGRKAEPGKRHQTVVTNYNGPNQKRQRTLVAGTIHGGDGVVEVCPSFQRTSGPNVGRQSDQGYARSGGGRRGTGAMKLTLTTDCTVPSSLVESDSTMPN